MAKTSSNFEQKNYRILFPNKYHEKSTNFHEIWLSYWKGIKQNVLLGEKLAC